MERWERYEESGKKGSFMERDKHCQMELYLMGLV